MGWKRTILNGTLILLLSLLVCGKPIQSADVPKIEMDPKKQTVTITMIDKKRSSSTYFETVGFTVCLEKTNGKPLSGGKGSYGIFWLSDGEKDSNDLDNGFVETTFTFPEAKVDKAFQAAGIDYQKLKDSNNKIYFNGIMVTHYSYGTSGKKYTLSGILATAPWGSRTQEDLKKRFDIKMEYQPGPVPVQLTYSLREDGKQSALYRAYNNKNGTNYTKSQWTKSSTSTALNKGGGLGFTKASYKKNSALRINGYSFPAKLSKVVDGIGEDYYLWKVYVADLGTKQTNHSDGYYFF